MAGKKISQLPPIASPALTDIYPDVQSGTTGQATLQQLFTLLINNIGSGTIPALTVTALTASTITAGTITFSPTTGGIVGTTTNDNAAAGEVGEYISQSVLIGASVAVTSNVIKTVASISLTAGDWDVGGTVSSNPAAGTTTQFFSMAISTVNGPGAITPTQGAENNFTGGYVNTLAGQQYQFTAGPMRVSLAATTTIYLVTYMLFSVSTMGAYGFIGARRVR